MIRRFLLIAALGFMVLGLFLIVGLPSDDEDTVELPTDGPVRTIFVGDSITAGVNPETFEPDDTYSWVPYAVADDRSPWELDASVAQFGLTLGQMALGFESQVLSQDPQGVVIMGGTNDALRQLPVEESIEWLRSMVTSAQDRGIAVWVIAPPPLDPAYERDLQALVDAQAELADAMDVPYVDVREDLKDADGNWVPGLTSDGVHPSEEGARRIADLILDEVDQ